MNVANKQVKPEIQKIEERRWRLRWFAEQVVGFVAVISLAKWKEEEGSEKEKEERKWNEKWEMRRENWLQVLSRGWRDRGWEHEQGGIGKNATLLMLMLFSGLEIDPSLFGFIQFFDCISTKDEFLFLYKSSIYTLFPVLRRIVKEGDLHFVCLRGIENGWMKKGWKSLAYGVWNRSENVGKTKIVLNGPCSNFFPIMRIAKQIWVRVVKYLNKVVYRHFGVWGENVKLNFIWQEY